MPYSWSGTANAANAASGTSLTLSVTYAVHDRVQVGITYGSPTTQTETVSDGTNTYAKIGSTLNDATNNQSYALYEVLDAASGTFTITLTLGAAEPFRAIWMAHQAGLQNTGSGQGTLVNRVSPGTGTDALTGGSITPASQPGMLMSVAYDDIANGAITKGTGFTDESNLANWDTAFTTSSRVEDKRLTSVAATNSTFTATTGTDTYAVWSVYVPEPASGAVVEGGGPGIFRITPQSWI